MCACAWACVYGCACVCFASSSRVLRAGVRRKPWNHPEYVVPAASGVGRECPERSTGNTLTQGVSRVSEAEQEPWTDGPEPWAANSETGSQENRASEEGTGGQRHAGLYFAEIRCEDGGVWIGESECSPHRAVVPGSGRPGQSHLPGIPCTGSASISGGCRDPWVTPSCCPRDKG